MFPEAFPLPRNMGGQPRRLHAPISQVAPSAGRCEYHTAIFTAFQLEVANISRLTATAPKLQTFDNSTQPPDRNPGFAS
jgi:hypothetical protein